jgi:hypothetical protein
MELDAADRLARQRDVGRTGDERMGGDRGVDDRLQDVTGPGRSVAMSVTLVWPPRNRGTPSRSGRSRNDHALFAECETSVTLRVRFIRASAWWFTMDTPRVATQR